MKSHSALCCATILVAGLWVHQAVGQVLTMSTEDLAKESSAILVGTCETLRSYWGGGREHIFTEVRVQVSEYLKGNLGPQAVITVPGGRVGNTIYEVTDMPLFVVGEEAVIYVWQHPSGKNLVTGADQGKLAVEKDPVTGEKTLRVPLSTDDGQIPLQLQHQLQAPPTRRVPLDEYLKEVRRFTKER